MNTDNPTLINEAIDLTWFGLREDLRQAILLDYQADGISAPAAHIEMLKVKFLVEPMPIQGGLYQQTTVIIGEIPDPDPDQYLLLCYDEDAHRGGKYGFRCLSTYMHY